MTTFESNASFSQANSAYLIGAVSATYGNLDFADLRFSASGYFKVNMSITLPSSIVLVIDNNDFGATFWMEYLSPSGGNAQPCSAATTTQNHH
jgi:hypothetical protein